MLTHAFAQAKHQWDEINKLPTRGAGKVHKKQLFLFAWQDELKETGKNFGPLFWEEMESLGITDTHSLEGTWVTAGRLASFVGAQEAREMISGGELRTKKNKHGRSLFFFSEEKQSRTATRQRTWSQKGTKELTAEEYDKGKKNFEGTKVPRLHARVINQSFFTWT